MNPFLIFALFAAGGVAIATRMGAKKDDEGEFYDIRTKTQFKLFNRTKGAMLSEPVSGPAIVVLYKPSNGRMGAEFRAPGRIVIAISTSALPDGAPPEVDAVVAAAVNATSPDKMMVVMGTRPPVGSRALLIKGINEAVEGAGPGGYLIDEEGKLVEIDVQNSSGMPWDFATVQTMSLNGLLSRVLQF